MKKRILTAMAAIGIIGASVAMFAAFESYVLEINAHLEPVLDVNPHGDWNLGTIYPEKDYAASINIGLSSSALADPNFTSVSYAVGCNPPQNGGKVNICNAILRSIDGGTEVSGAVIITNSLDNSDTKDTVSINFVAPDCENKHQKEPNASKVINCDPDGDGVNEGVDVGAGIYVKVLQITQDIPDILNKAGCDVVPTTGVVTCPTATPGPE